MIINTSIGISTNVEISTNIVFGTRIRSCIRIYLDRMSNSLNIRIRINISTTSTCNNIISSSISINTAL